MNKMRAFSACLLLAVLTACGGGSDAPAASDDGGGGQAGGAGTDHLWSGTFDTDVAGGPNKVPVYGVRESTTGSGGEMMFFDTHGDVLTFPSGGDNTGDLTEFAEPGLVIDTFGDHELIFDVVDVVFKNDSIVGDWHGGFGSSGGFEFAPYDPFDGEPTSIAVGGWDGFFLGSLNSAHLDVTDTSFTITRSFTGTDGTGCIMSGVIKRPDPGQNFFTVSIASSGAGAFCSYRQQGFAFESHTDLGGVFGNAKGDYYYIFVSSIKGAHVMELKAP